MYAIKLRTRLVATLSGLILVWPLVGLAEAQLVLDLIQAENAHLKLPKTSPAQVQSKDNEKVRYEGPDLVLEAMYGVGKRVLAEVRFKGQSYLYLHGQAWPVGDYQGRSGLRLVAMRANCIELALKDESFDACVLPHGGQR